MERRAINAGNRTLVLDNKINREVYKVLIIPGKSHLGTISTGVLRKARDFFDKGGVVICTSKLPSRSAEPGMDEQVRELVQSIFGIPPENSSPAFSRNANPNGGQAWFIPDIDEVVGGIDRLTSVLREAIDVWDVRFEESSPFAGRTGELTCIHKVRDNCDYYFFANSSDAPIDTWVSLRGSKNPQLMNTHTGAIAPAVHEQAVLKGIAVTRIRLKLGPNRSVFIHGKVQPPKK